MRKKGGSLLAVFYSGRWPFESFCLILSPVLSKHNEACSSSTHQQMLQKKVVGEPADAFSYGLRNSLQAQSAGLLLLPCLCLMSDVVQINFSR